MAIKVLDFYADGKLHANPQHKLLMQDALFCILVEVNGVPRELATTVTKKYHYSCYQKYSEFNSKKVHEYNVLMDFLVHAKSRVMSKWELSELDYEELLNGLELHLIDRYCECGEIRRLVLLGKGLAKKFIINVRRRLGQC